MPSAYRTMSWFHIRQSFVPLTVAPVLKAWVYVLMFTELVVVALVSMSDESITVPSEL